ncbi:MAG: PPC domain-containing protein [Planctomycetia bacterium]|nr:PPC domain-containing protein [Planctomycetia bacterium]
MLSLRRIFLVSALVASANAASAQRIHQIESVLPRVAQRGTSLDVVIRGVQLVEPREIIFYRPGIRCTAIGPVTEILSDKGLPVKFGLAHGGRIDEEIRCRFEIALDAPLGEHPFHLCRATSITMIGSIHVTPFPVVDEMERGLNSNDTREKAIDIVPNVTVRGGIKQQAVPDVDLYRVAVKAGQRIAVEVDVVRITDTRIGASEVDMAVRILDESGVELGAADDSALHTQDPILAVKIPRDGFVFIEVKQSTYTPITAPAFSFGGIQYSLHVGTNRRPLAAYPPGGPIGSHFVVKFLGDPLGEHATAVTMAAEPGTFESFADAPSALPLRASPYPNVLEAVPTPAQLQARAKLPPSARATRVEQLPTALNGIIAEPGELDSFRLSVKKGSRWRVRAFASALGSPLDPVVRLRPIEADGSLGPVELEGDDSTPQERDIFGHYPRSGGGFKDVLDPSLIWAPKADGDYVLEITDTAGGGSPVSVYRVEIEPASDGLACVLFWQGTQAHQGSNQGLSIRVEGMQGNTYAGEIEIVAHGLPEGVKFVCPRIPKGTPLPIFEWPMQLVTTAAAPLGSALISLEARAVDGSQTVRSEFQSKAPFIYQVGGDSFHLIQLQQVAFAVNDPAPFSIEVPPPTTALVRNGELAVPVKIRRRNGFTEPITLDFLWLPTGVGKEAALTIPDGQSEAVLKMSAASNAKLGDWALSVKASAVLDPKRAGVTITSDFVTLTVAESFVELAAQPDSLRRGERKRYVWTVKSKNPFDGSATAKLLGLPKGVTQIGTPPTLTKETAEIAFEIEATDEALLGPIAGVSCEVVLQAGGQEIHQRSGSATLRIDPKL